MRASARTTQGGIRRIRTGGCAAIGPLARNRPSDPDASTSRQSTKPVTEAEAIRLAQAGDAAAFEFLYHLHSRRVYALCLRMVNNPSDAEDLMQEAFLQLFRKIGTFRGESALPAPSLHPTPPGRLGSRGNWSPQGHRRAPSPPARTSTSRRFTGTE